MSNSAEERDFSGQQAAKDLMQESVQASTIVCLSVSQVFPRGGLVAQLCWSEVEEPLGGGT